MMRFLSMLLTFSLLAFGAFAGAPDAEEAPLTLKLWPDGAPGKVTEKPESAVTKGGVTRISHVSEPTLTLYPARGPDQVSPAVVVCPGGAYNILAIDKEGTEVAEWLRSIGITAAVLKYRVPDNRAGALEDVRQAMRVVRSRATDWHIDPERVGLIGFSAGGHLAARVGSHAERPDFTMLLYPAYLSRDGSRLADEIKVSQDTPPTFMVFTRDDRAFVGGGILYDRALKEAGVPIETHFFEKGGHGYGLRPSEHPVSAWPKRCEAWLDSIGMTGGSSAEASEVFIRVEPSGAVFMNEQLMTLEEFTHRLPGMEGESAVVTMPVAETNSPPGLISAAVLQGLTQIGSRLLVVEADGSYTQAAADQSTANRTLKLSSEQIEKLWNLHRDLDRTETSPSKLPALGLTFEQNSELDVLELDGVEIGLPGRRAWIVNRQGESGDMDTTIELKKSW